ncbi:hypothetical protein CYMTET_48858 [Cymbomonas tetramitiformis]|uniref:Ion transport domain-containing protein n=1 Tax=Cymbomonas tetramitiformis TaxID=36881 RepID=A0AAE0BRI2_9CHLO|nr:hypothetical protein CYMTET_48858 [Cymbomonas tetramitiformis]
MPVSEQTDETRAIQISSKGASTKSDETWTDPVVWLWREHRLFPPASDNKQRWDLVMTVFVVYNCVVIPLQMAFLIEALDVQNVMDTIIDSLFIVDIFINFRTALMDEYGEFVVDKTIIAHEYFNTWFPLDFVASFPFDLVARILRLNVNLTVLSMLKMPRLLRLGRLLKKLEQMAAANAFRIVKLMAGFLLFAHWIGCIWWVVGSADFNIESSWGEPWIHRVNDDGLTTDSPLTERYMSSLYWSLTTLMKSPFLAPSTVPELAFAGISVVIGAVLFAAMLGNVTAMIQSFDKTGAELRAKMATLRLFAHNLKVPVHVAERLYSQLDEEHTVTNGLDAVSILNELPASLQRDVVLRSYETLIHSCTLFEGVGQQCTIDICKRLQIGVLRKGEMLTFKEQPTNTLFFLVHGTVKVSLEEPTSRASSPKNPSRWPTINGSSGSNPPSPVEDSPGSCVPSRAVVVTEQGNVFGFAEVFNSKWKCPYSVITLKLTRYFTLRQRELADVIALHGGDDALAVCKNLEHEHRKLLDALHGLTNPLHSSGPSVEEDCDEENGLDGSSESSAKPDVEQMSDTEHISDVERIRAHVHRLDDRLTKQSEAVRQIKGQLSLLRRHLMAGVEVQRGTSELSTDEPEGSAGTDAGSVNVTPYSPERRPSEDRRSEGRRSDEVPGCRELRTYSTPEVRLGISLEDDRRTRGGSHDMSFREREPSTDEIRVASLHRHTTFQERERRDERREREIKRRDKKTVFDQIQAHVPMYSENDEKRHPPEVAEAATDVAVLSC